MDTPEHVRDKATELARAGEVTHEDRLRAKAGLAQPRQGGSGGILLLSTTP